MVLSLAVPVNAITSVESVKKKKVPQAGNKTHITCKWGYTASKHKV
jgi:hypothetical protein